MTTKKHQDFVCEPLGNKGVEALPGIGKVIGYNMRQQGYAGANQLLGQYLVMRQNPAAFRQFVMGFGANRRQQNHCYMAMEEWSRNFIN